MRREGLTSQSSCETPARTYPGTRAPPGWRGRGAAGALGHRDMAGIRCGGSWLPSQLSSLSPREPAGNSGIHPRELKILVHTKTFIHSQHHLGAAKVPFGRRMDTEGVGHPDNGIVFCTKKTKKNKKTQLSTREKTERTLQCVLLREKPV